MINSRSLIHLDDDFRHLVLRWQQECASAGLDVLIIQTYRDECYQNWLYAKGRTAAGKIVTNAKGGESLHNATIDGKPNALALDFCIMDGRECDWNNLDAFTKAGMIAESLGLIWSGRWVGKLRETGHIQLDIKKFDKQIRG